MAECELKVEIENVAPEISKHNGIFERMLKFKVVSLGNQGVHSQTHCSDYPGKTIHEKVTGTNKKRLSALKKGSQTILFFRTSSLF